MLGRSQPIRIAQHTCASLMPFPFARGQPKIVGECVPVIFVGRFAMVTALASQRCRCHCHRRRCHRLPEFGVVTERPANPHQSHAHDRVITRPPSSDPRIPEGHAHQKPPPCRP